MTKMAKTDGKHNLIKRCDERKVVHLVQAIRAEDAEIELKLLHNNGFVVLAVAEPVGKSDKCIWHQWAYTKEEIDNLLIQNILGTEYSTYISMNSFKSPRRLISNLYSLNAFWSDIDYYKKDAYKDKSYLEMIEIISRCDLMQKIPPSLWIYSGNGIYPIWLLEDAYAKACLPIWNLIMETIHKELECYGADPSSVEPSRVLRLAGSNNPKTENKAKIVKDIFSFKSPKRYTINEISAIILPDLEHTKEEWQKIKIKKRKSKKEKKACKVKSLYNIHTLNYARMEDIQKLIELRNGDCKGTRELMVFLYRYWGNCYFKDKETALKEALNLNAMFKEPLSEDEVINATKSAEDAALIWEEKFESYLKLEKKPKISSYFKNTGCYVYNNKKLIELLQITQEEMESPLRTIINTKEKNRRNKDYRKEYKRLEHRNSNGLTYREQAKMDKIYLIIELSEKGLNQSKIAENLGVTRQAVSKLMKEIKEKNISIENNTNADNKPLVELERITDNELKLMII